MPQVAPLPVFFGLLLCCRHCCRHSGTAMCPQAKCEFSILGRMDGASFGSILSPSLIWSSSLMLCLPPFFCIPLKRPMCPCDLPFAHPVPSTWYTLLPSGKLLLLQGRVQASFSQWTHSLPSISCFLHSVFFMLNWQLFAWVSVFPVRWVVMWRQGSCLLWSFPGTELGLTHSCPVQIRWSNLRLAPTPRVYLSHDSPLSHGWHMGHRHKVVHLWVPIVCLRPVCGYQTLNDVAYLFMVLICSCPPAETRGSLLESGTSSPFHVIDLGLDT